MYILLLMFNKINPFFIALSPPPLTQKFPTSTVLLYSCMPVAWPLSIFQVLKTIQNLKPTSDAERRGLNSLKVITHSRNSLDSNPSSGDGHTILSFDWSKNPRKNWRRQELVLPLKVNGSMYDSKMSKDALMKSSRGKSYIWWGKFSQQIKFRLAHRGDCKRTVSCNSQQTKNN